MTQNITKFVHSLTTVSEVFRNLGLGAVAVLFLMWSIDVPPPQDGSLQQWEQFTASLRNLGLAFAGFLAGTIGLYLAWRRTTAATQQADIAQESHHTELFTKAIDQLGNESPPIRVGGIYALERIASDSIKDHRPIMEVLSSYLRQSIKIPNQAALQEQLQGSIKAVPARKPDIAAALTVLGRRSRAYETSADKIDLNMTNLHGALLNGLDLSHTIFFRAVLYNVSLKNAKIQYADFTKADLRKARLQNSDLRWARLVDANLLEAKLIGGKLGNANFQDAILENAHLNNVRAARASFSGAILRGANLSGGDFHSAELKNATIGEPLPLDGNPEQVVQRINYLDYRRPNLIGTDFTGASGLTVEQCVWTRFDNTTRFPEGFDVEELNRLRGPLNEVLAFLDGQNR